jgi:putative cell wall-binding protein
VQPLSRLAVVLLLIAGAAGAALEPAEGATPPAPAVSADWVVFIGQGEAGAGGSTEVFRVRADGSDRTQITSDGVAKGEAIPSPDGTRIAYARQEADGSWVLVVQSLFGRPAQLVAKAINAGAPAAWDQLGDRLAYGSGVQVRAVDPDGTSDWTQYSAPGEVGAVQWAGRDLVFMTRPSAGNAETGARLFLGEAGKSKEARRPTGGPRGVPTVGRFGSQFAVAWGTEIAVFRSSSGSTDLFSSTVGHNGLPTFRPTLDSSVLAIAGPTGVRVVEEVVGGRNQPIDSAGTTVDVAPQWSSDGNHLTFVGTTTEGSSQIFVAPAAGGPARRIVDSGIGKHASPRFVPSSFGSTARSAGSDRIATAVEISRRAFGSAAKVVIARADSYADALAASPLAGGAPVLLTTKESLPASVAAELRRLGATSAVVMGTSDVIGVGVESELRGLGLSVDRVGGANRFATAAEVGRRSSASHGWLVKGADAHPSRGWEDAVAVSAVAAATGEPVLLTNSSSLPAETAAALERLSSVTIVGGFNAVSEAVEASVREKTSVDRLAGSDRYNTSTLLAARATMLDGATVWLASGADWADAVAAGPAAAAGKGMLLLVHPTDLSGSASTKEWLTHRTSIKSAVLVGGPVAISPRIGRDLWLLLAGR